MRKSTFWGVASAVMLASVSVYAGVAPGIGTNALVLANSTMISATGDPYTWPAYSPTLDYNWKRDAGTTLSTPTQDYLSSTCKSSVKGTQSDGWWTFHWGSSANSLVTTAAITPLLARMNKDFAYIRDTMGWPPDARAQNGYRSAVFLYGSGLCSDNASNTELGGWQSEVDGYPMVLLSYYPVYSFDPSCSYSDKVSQQGACVHEGIHSVLAGMAGVKQAAWFHEGGNTWLQQEMEARRTGQYTDMGFLNGAALLAPFMPIECYSGWLQDGTFGGPSAEGVDMTNSSGAQVCTWRGYLGGTQYGNIFPTFLGTTLGLGCVPWIWKNCSGRVLEGMAATLGEEQIRRLISEYRAKQALLDFGKWASACKVVLDYDFGTSLEAEWSPYNVKCDTWKATPYAKTTNDGSGLLTPEERTTPGWSGANQIPLKVSGSSVTVTFNPIGANMTCQLCYRATDGTPVYSEIVKTGDCTLRLDKTPANSVVIAVITNTDYKYLGETTRSTHYKYTLKIGTGVTATADINTKWYNVTLTVPVNEPVSKVKTVNASSSELSLSLENRSTVVVGYHLDSPTDATISLYTAYGALVKHLSTSHKQAGNYTEKFDMTSVGVAPGTYLFKLKTKKGIATNSITFVK